MSTTPAPDQQPMASSTRVPSSNGPDEPARSVQEERLRDAILDIDAHATALGEDEDGFVTGGYIISVGSLHRALGVVGHTAPLCRLCDPSQHTCLTTWGALAVAAQEWADADDLLDRAQAEERLRDAVRRWRA